MKNVDWKSVDWERVLNVIIKILTIGLIHVKNRKNKNNN